MEKTFASSVNENNTFTATANATLYDGTGLAYNASQYVNTIKVTFAEAYPVNNPIGTVGVNKYLQVSDQVDFIENNILTALFGEGVLSADNVEITVYGGYSSLTGYYALDAKFLGAYWGNLVFDDVTEKIKVVIPADQSKGYPAVTVEKTITIVDSRPTTSINVDDSITLDIRYIMDDETITDK